MNMVLKWNICKIIATTGIKFDSDLEEYDRELFNTIRIIAFVQPEKIQEMNDNNS